MREGLRRSRVLRVIAAVICGGGLALLVVRHLRDSPSDVQLTLSLGSAAEALVSLDLRAIRRAGDVVVYREHRSFSRAAPAPSSLTKRLALRDGDYRVEVDLHYRGAPPKRMRTGTRSTPLGASALRVSRRLPIDGSGALTIVIGD